MAEHRILVVANETVAGRELLDELRRRAGGDSDVLVVAPALNSRLRYLFADVDRAREQAETGCASRSPRCRWPAFARMGRSATRTRCGRWRTRCSSFTPTRS